MTTIENILKIMKKNKKLIRKHYNGYNFDVAEDDGNLSIFINTKYKKLPSKERAEEIRRLFNAREVMYIEGDGWNGIYWENPPFWSIQLK